MAAAERKELKKKKEVLSSERKTANKDYFKQYKLKRILTEITNLALEKFKS